MKNKILVCFVVAAASLVTAGCSQPAPPAAGASGQPQSAAPVAPSDASGSPPGTSVGAAATGDQAAPAALQAGIEAMGTRVASTVDAYSKVEPTPSFRYFMHPTVEKDASIEFNTSDLSSVTLSPRIGDLNAECAGDPAAGIVEMRYSLDGGVPTTITVDRTYNTLIPLDVSAAQKMKVDVSHGNGVATCDWFGLGVLDVKTK